MEVRRRQRLAGLADLSEAGGSHGGAAAHLAWGHRIWSLAAGRARGRAAARAYDGRRGGWPLLPSLSRASHAGGWPLSRARLARPKLG